MLMEKKLEITRVTAPVAAPTPTCGSLACDLCVRIDEGTWSSTVEVDVEIKQGRVTCVRSVKTIHPSKLSPDEAIARQEAVFVE